MSALRKFKVRVDSIKQEATDIRSYRLINPQGGELPEFAAGAHIDVHLENGLIRQYSISGPAWERHSYVIGVLLEHPGTGGSQFVHKNVKEGDYLEISEPKQMFKLNPNAQRHLLIAGGIGIVPILSMVYTLERSKADYTVHYCTKSPEATAFKDDIEQLVKHGNLVFHFDGGNPADGLDLNETLKDYTDGTHLYYCGPLGMMNAAAKASEHWPSGTVHYELFSPEGLEPSKSELTGEEQSFDVRIASTGMTYSVPSDKSIVEVLRENGLEIDTSCEDGFCGTCMTRYLDGEPEHRDQVLDEEDHEEFVLICCARSRTPELLLDL